MRSPGCCADVEWKISPFAEGRGPNPATKNNTDAIVNCSPLGSVAVGHVRFCDTPRRRRLQGEEGPTQAVPAIARRRTCRWRSNRTCPDNESAGHACTVSEMHSLVWRDLVGSARGRCRAPSAITAWYFLSSGELIAISGGMSDLGSFS